MTGNEAEAIFMQVINQNCQMLINGIQFESLTEGKRIFYSELSEDEIRRQAVGYFYFKLSDKVSEKLKMYQYTKD